MGADVSARVPPAPQTASSAGRDPVVDLVRAGSIVVVVLGHWLMAWVAWDGGTVRTGNLLSVVPALQPLTWVLQVMPLFFVVGGFTNGRSWRSTRARGGSYADFVAHRTARLLRPLWPFLAAWVVAAAVLVLRGASSGAVRDALLVAVQPLWFVALYLLVVACTPVMLRLHERYGALVLVALAAVVGLVDVVRIGLGWAPAGYVNYAAAWLFAHQLGFFADGAGRLSRGRLVLASALALATLVALTTVGPYPASMVGLPEDRVSNLSPPTVCVVVLAVWEVSLVLLARPALARAVRRPEVAGVVVAVNRVVMTVFVWHLTALVVVSALGATLHVPMPPVASTAWWLLRPVWLLALTAVLLGLVLVAGPVERAGLRRRPDSGARGWATVASAIGVAWVVLGLSGLALSGLAGLWAGRVVPLLHLQVGPVVALVDLALGALIVATAAAARPRVGLGAAAAVAALAGTAWPVLAGAVPGVPGPGTGGAVSYLVTSVALLPALALPVSRGSAATGR